MKYSSYAYLFPPRPENAVPPSAYAFYERRGWTREAKKNGESNVIFVAPDRSLTCMTRHKTLQSRWSPSEASGKAFKSLPGTGWFVFCAELLHAKVVGGPKDTNYVHDILVADGQCLYGVSYQDRCAIIDDLFGVERLEQTATHYLVNENTWIAKRSCGGTAAFFEGLNDLEDEGIVLKNPRAPLAFCSRTGSNSDWQMKSRRETKVFNV